MPERHDRRAQRLRLGRHERALRERGYRRIAGADEAGAGPLAGPLVAAAVILPVGARLPEVDDSKRLSAAQRERCQQAIVRQAIGWSVAIVEVDEFEPLGPYRASVLALTRAVRQLEPPPDYLLVDARRLPILGLPQESVIAGDSTHLSIAAASILAKVCRDRLMLELDRRYPDYGFARHKGYGTAEHLQALERHGPCPAHRRRYAPVQSAITASASISTSISGSINFETSSIEVAGRIEEKNSP